MSESYEIRKSWNKFRKLHGMAWYQKPGYTGPRDKGWHLDWPEGFKDFLEQHGITQHLVETKKTAMTPDGRVVKMKDIIFVCPSKEIAMLFKLSYL